MAGLFDMKDGKFIVNPERLIIPPFREIWERDKTKTKEVAIAELSFVYFVADFESPYANFPEDERLERVKADFLTKYKVRGDELLNRAIAKYQEFQSTHSMRLLKSAQSAADKMSGYFKSVDFTAQSDDGKLLYVAKDVATTLGNVGKIIESLDKVEEKVKKEIKTEVKIRGGGKASPYER